MSSPVPPRIKQSLSWNSRYPAYQVPPHLPRRPPPPFPPHPAHPRQVDFAAANTGKKVALTKRRVRWRFGYPSTSALSDGKTGTDCRGEEHEVSLVWSLTSGKKSVVFDNQEVHCSDGRQAMFEFGWSRDNKHVYKIVAHATGGGDRQYDFLVDGQSFFDMPKVFELGLPNAGRRTVRLRSTGETVQLAGPSRPAGGYAGGDEGAGIPGPIRSRASPPPLAD